MVNRVKDNHLAQLKLKTINQGKEKSKRKSKKE